MQIEFSEQHDKTGWINNEKEDCQLFVAMTGQKQFIREMLNDLIKSLDDSYGKPRQGIILHHNGSIDIQTPIWEGQRY